MAEVVADGGEAAVPLGHLTGSIQTARIRRTTTTEHQETSNLSPVFLDLLGEASQESKQPRPNFERKADEFAASFLIPSDKLQSFITRVKPLFSKQRIRAFAAKQQVHPGIVVGQLHHAGAISYAHSRDLLEKVRGTLTEATMTDGWGSMLPVSM